MIIRRNSLFEVVRVDIVCRVRFLMLFIVLYKVGLFLSIYLDFLFFCRGEYIEIVF